MIMVREVARDAYLAVGTLAECQEPLLGAEEPLTIGCTLARVAELRAGRALARRAMLELGVVAKPVLTGNNGEPVWPTAVCGSISHTRTYAAVLVADAAAYWSVGIDINDQRSLGDPLARQVATESEIQEIHRLCSWSDAPNVAFSAKEAFYKFQFPITGATDLAFSDVTLLRGPNDSLGVSCERIATFFWPKLLSKTMIYASNQSEQLICWVICPRAYV